jgi:hypothetical protein
MTAIRKAQYAVKEMADATNVLETLAGQRGRAFSHGMECNEDPARFPELGYCIYREGLSPQELTTYSAYVDDALTAGRPLGEMHAFDASWRLLCCHPKILRALQFCLATPELILFFSSAFVKRPHDAKRVEWHQDNTYWPAISGTDVVTVWVALDDVDEDNSCMHVVPRSHEGYRELEMLPVEDKAGAMLGRRVEITDQMSASAVPLVLNTGQFSIHDSHLVHGSGPNHSARRRAGYTIRYGNALTTKVDVALHKYGDHEALPVYYVRGDGAGLHEGYEDVRALSAEW